MPGHATRNIPAAALTMTIGEFALGDNGEGAKSAPVTITARSGQPVEHWYWGRIVHDLSGMTHKSRVAIDYCHRQDEPIGYLNKFDIASGDLVTSGALVPYGESDRATEVIHKSQNGVPYEASINFGGDGIVLEEVGEGASVEVNGTTFSGPGVVVRKWPLRGVAVCIYGQDANTSTEFAGNREVPVLFTNSIGEEDIMSNPAEATQAVETDTPAEANENPEAVEAEQTETEEATEPATGENAVEPITGTADSVTIEPVNAGTTELSAPGQQFIDAFGEQQGSIYFARGLTFEQAQQKHVEALSAENAQLRQRLDQLAADRGVDGPVELSTPTTEPGQDDELVKLTRAFDGDTNRAQRVLDMRAAQQK